MEHVISQTEKKKAELEKKNEAKQLLSKGSGGAVVSRSSLSEKEITIKPTTKPKV